MEKRSYSEEEINVAALNVLSRSIVEEDRIESTLYSVLKVIQGEMDLEMCATVAGITQEEMKPLIDATKSLLASLKVNGAQVQQDAKSVILPRAQLKDAKDSIIKSSESKKKTNVTLPHTKNYGFPSHWTKYPEVISSAVDSAIETFKMPEKKSHLREQIFDVVLRQKTLASVSRDADGVNVKTLRRYSRLALENITKILGENSVDPEVKNIIGQTPLKSFKELEEIVDSKQKMAVSSNTPVKTQNTFLPPRPLLAKRRITSSTEVSSSKRGRSDSLSHGTIPNVSSVALATLSKVNKEKKGPESKKKFCGSDKELRGVIEDRLCGRYENLQSLVGLVSTVIQLDYKLKKDNISVEQLFAAYQFCAASVNLDEMVLVAKKSISSTKKE